MEKYAKSSGPSAVHKSARELTETLKETSKQSSVDNGINILVAHIESCFVLRWIFIIFHIPVTLNNGLVTETFPFFLSL